MDLENAFNQIDKVPLLAEGSTGRARLGTGTCATEATASSCSDHPKFSRHGWCQINKDNPSRLRQEDADIPRWLPGRHPQGVTSSRRHLAPRRGVDQEWRFGIRDWCSALCIWCSVLVCVIACSRCCFRCPCPCPFVLCFSVLCCAVLCRAVDLCRHAMLSCSCNSSADDIRHFTAFVPIVSLKVNCRVNLNRNPCCRHV